MTSTRKRILTGDRPTGYLHLGHYVGTLANRVRLQDEYECFFIIADLHMLTTHYDRIPNIAENARQLVYDYLGVGIDPDRSTIYLQSLVPEVTELMLLFSMLVTVPRLQRVPTLKDQMQAANFETATMGLLSYPVLQAADIMMVRANLVPVGKDQASHLEVTREIAERFNTLYGNVFP
ncbi:MAG TPA: tryptophan--tRNA ligase, partial [Acidobacteriota bacterium]